MSATTRAAYVRRTATGALVTLLALSGCGTQVAPAGGSDLPVLRIGSAAAVTGAADMAARSSQGGETTLDGTLPDGPDSAAVQRFPTGPTSEDRVRALGASLGLTADPVRRAHGWETSGTGALLRVRDADGEWSFSRTGLTCPAYLVDVEAESATTGVACAQASRDGATPTAAVPVPDDAAALAAAGPVLAAAGTTGDPRVLDRSGGLARTVVVDPLVAGLPTSGFRTTLDVDRDGVAAAYGRLGSPSEGARYPLVAARTAYASLAAQPRVLPQLACVQAEDKATVCPEASPVVVTGAVLGLELASEAGVPVLVPAWLFRVRGSDEPLAAIAVEPRYLADPEPSPGSSQGGSTGPGGRSEPIPPTATAPPSAGSGSSSAAITTARVSADGRTLTLVGYGGTCAVYLGIGDESTTAVKAQIVGTPTIGPDQACNDMAVEVEVRVSLEAPLGSRTVTDATTGLPVRVTRG